jgi:hypothetical protein
VNTWLRVAKIELLMLATASGLISSGCAVPDTPSPEEHVAGHIELNQTPFSDSGGGGNGTIYFQGRQHRFTIGGLGVGGEAIAVLQTTGEAYQLNNFIQFRGTYRQVPAVPDSGGLWIGNSQGIVIHLQPPPGGRLPPLGDDAVLIETYD